MKSFRNVVDGEIRFSISPQSPCPCGSGKPASNCCLSETGFSKASASSMPPLPKTGYSLDGCYAANLGDCSNKLSREHYFPESILRHLNRYEDLKVSGLPWLKGEEHQLPPDAFTTRTLCTRHNSALSEIDSTALRLFQALNEEGAIGSGQQILYLFSGHDVERWLLKTLCGLIESKSLVPNDDRYTFSIERSWIEILFGYANFEDGQGLYVCGTPGQRFDGPLGFQRVQAIGRDDGKLDGLVLRLNGYEFIFSMSGFPTRQFDERTLTHRPFEIYTQGRDFEKSVILSWQGAADLGTVALEIIE